MIYNACFFGILFDDFLCCFAYSITPLFELLLFVFALFIRRVYGGFWMMRFRVVVKYGFSHIFYGFIMGLFYAFG